MAQVSPAFSHPSSEHKPSLPGGGHTCGLGSACRGRRALEAASGAQGGAGSCHHAGEARGSCREIRADSMLPFLEPREEGDTSGGRGGDERGPGNGTGEGTSLPLSTLPPLPRSATNPSSAHRTSGKSPFSSFHLSAHRPQGAAVLSFSPALRVQGLGCPGGAQAPEGWLCSGV